MDWNWGWILKENDTGFAKRAWHLHLWLLKFQVFPVLNGEINVLQDDVDALLVGPIEWQEANYAVVVDLNETQCRQVRSKIKKTGSVVVNLILSAMDRLILLLFRIWELSFPIFRK